MLIFTKLSLALCSRTRFLAPLDTLFLKKALKPHKTSTTLSLTLSVLISPPVRTEAKIDGRDTGVSPLAVLASVLKAAVHLITLS